MLLLLKCLEVVAMAIGSDMRVKLKGYLSTQRHAYTSVCMFEQALPAAA